MFSRTAYLLALMGSAAVLAPVAPVQAQDTLGAVILRGASSRAGTTQPGTPTRLERGMRLESPQGSWTELAFSDGSSIVLEPSAVLTVQGISRDARSGHLVLRARSDRGKLRIATADELEVLLGTTSAEVRIVAASAVINAGPGGSVTLVSGTRVVVARDGREEVIRRPGFSIAFSDAGVQRQTRGGLLRSLDVFAPVAMGGNQTDATAVRVDSAPASAGLTFAGPNRAAGVTGQNANDAVALPPAAGNRNTTGPGNGGNGGGNTAPMTAGRREAGSFDIAGLPLPGSSTRGSEFAAPGYNSGTTSVDGRNNFDVANAQDPTRSIIGLTSQDRFVGTSKDGLVGTGRIRRFSPEGTGTARTSSGALLPRKDSGLITLGSTPAPLSQYFQFLNKKNVTQQIQKGTTFYDGIANIGVVTLKLWQPQPGKDTGVNLGANYINFPRFSVTDQNQPLFVAEGQIWVQVKSNDPTSFLRQADGSPAYFFTKEKEASVPNVGYKFVRLEYTNNNTSGTVGTVPIWVQKQIGDSRTTLKSNGLTIYYTNSEKNRTQPAPGYEFSELKIDQLARYRGSAILEVGLRDIPVSSAKFPAGSTNLIVSPPPNNGSVFKLSGENELGLAVYVNNKQLPGISYYSSIGGADTVSSIEARSTGSGTIDTVSPRVYIIDKITAGSEGLSTRGIEPGERYFVIGGTSIAPGTGAPLPGLATNSVTRFAISDGLNPQGGFREGETIEAQYASANRPAAFSQYNAFRPEETFVPGPRGDTHLLVVGGAAPATLAGARNPAFRTDLQVNANGQTSGSVTVGSIGVVNGKDLALSGALVGSGRTAGINADSRLVKTNVGSLGTDDTGTGAHIFPNAKGQPGYFAVGESDVRVGPPTSPQSGTIEAVGGGGSSPFAFTRLATNVGPVQGGPAQGALASSGFATGIVESRAGGTGSLYGMSSAGLGHVQITSQPDNNREFDATLRMSPTAVGELSSDPQAALAPNGLTTEQILSFGADRQPAGTPTTAAASLGTFAAIIPDKAAMASVDAGLKAGIAGGGQLPPSNEHLAWGFFLGDLANTANGRDHVGFGLWLAGRQVGVADLERLRIETLRTLSGRATYSGGLIGNVAEPGTLRTATGSFSHTWDFSNRTGTMGANFDQRSFGIGTAMPAGTNVFSGSGPGGDRTMAVQGAFFHNPAIAGQVAASNLPAATGGLFGIRGPGYGANGIFVGARP